MNRIWVLSLVIVALVVWGTREAQHQFEDKMKSTVEQRKAALDRLEALHMGRAVPEVPQQAKKDSRLEDFHMKRGEF